MTETALGLTKAGSFQVPALIADIGPEATKRYFEFFTVPVRNKNTRIAYYHAIGQFLEWCQTSSALNQGVAAFHDSTDRIVDGERDPAARQSVVNGFSCSLAAVSHRKTFDLQGFIHWPALAPTFGQCGRGLGGREAALKLVRSNQ
jgi:hypothetical protein